MRIEFTSHRAGIGIRDALRRRRPSWDVWVQVPPVAQVDQTGRRKHVFIDVRAKFQDERDHWRTCMIDRTCSVYCSARAVVLSL